MKKKIFLTLVLCLSFIPTLFPQYGGTIGIDDMNGLGIFQSPFVIICILCYLVGVWMKSSKINNILSYAGSIGIVLSLLYFMIFARSNNMEFHNFWERISYGSQLTFPMFYVGLVCSIMVVVILYFTNRKTL